MRRSPAVAGRYPLCMIDLCLLGTGGTIPLPQRWLSALLVRVGSELALFDCGEGTQVCIRRSGWGFKPLSAIFLSHLHADHVSGLPGLLLSLGNAGRTDPVDIYGPVGTRIVVAGLRVVAPYLPYEVRVHELAGGQERRWSGATVATVDLDHAVPCLGYRVDVARSARFQPERAAELGVPVTSWSVLQRGQSVRVGDRLVRPSDVLGPPRRGLRIGYVTDTRPTPELPGFLAGADLLVLEGTYGDPADAENAIANKHLLFSEAAAIAREAGARALWLTHFSAKMLDPGRFQAYATRVFPRTTIGTDGLKTTLRFEDAADGEAPTPAATPTRLEERPA